MSFKKIFSEKNIFYFLIGVSLFMLWYPKYIVFGDGPAHVYNSKILADLLLHKHSDFYYSYYDIVIAPVPNWFSHVGLLLLQSLLNPFVSEKIFLSAYVVLFVFSFRFFSKQINSSSSFNSLLAFPFLFHYLFFFGFYNYCFGIAFSLLFVGCWLKWRTGHLLKQLSILLPLSLLVFFTHPLGWLLIAVILVGFFCIEIVELFARNFSKNNLRLFIYAWLSPTIAALIPLFFSIKFVVHHVSDAQFYPETFSRLWQAFSGCEMITIYSDSENIVAQIFVILLCSAAFFSILFRIKSKAGFGKGDSLLIAAVMFLIIYFLQPFSLSIAGFWIGRMSWVPWFLFALWLSSVEQNNNLKKILGVIGCVTFLCLTIIRLPFLIKNSDAEKDYLSACNYIQPHSLVLPLSFCNYGCNSAGVLLNKKIQVFQHAFDYCGAIKPTINLVNYEATTPWFPVQWKKNCDPFKLLYCAECQPPNVLLSDFEKNKCHGNIDYVVTWCMKYQFTETEQSKYLQTQLEKEFVLIYQSPTERTQLWKNKLNKK